MSAKQNPRSTRRATRALAIRSAAYESLETRVMLSAIPAPLAEADIGTPTGGSSSYNAGTFTVTGSGHDLFGAADAFHFIYQTLSGDGSVVVRVDTVSPDPDVANSLAGLTIRSSLQPTAANMFFAARDDGSVFVNDRTTDSAPGINVNLNQPGTLGEFLKLDRTGTTITASVSNDGTNYSLVAVDTINLPSTAFVGIAVASQVAPTQLTTATMDQFSVTPAVVVPLSGHVTAAKTLTGPQSGPTQFTVTYTGGTFPINASTIGSSNIVVTGPNYSQPATLVSTGLANGQSVSAVYQVSGVTAPGQYVAQLAANQIADTNGTFLPAGNLGGFNLVADVKPPTAALTSAPVITLGQPYQFSITYSDNADVKASSLGNTNVKVTGPGGYSQFATLVSTGLTDAPKIVATYSIPAPTVAGSYNIEVQGSSVTDTSGNAAFTLTVGAASTPGNAIIAGTVKNIDGSPAAGRNVFLDLQNTGTFVATDPSTVTDASGNYSFSNLTAGTYSVVQVIPAGVQLVEPSSGTSRSVIVTAGQTSSGVNFVDDVAATGSAAVSTALSGPLPASVIGGSKGKVTLRITNTNATKVSGKILVTLLASPDGTVSHAVATVKTFAVSLHLAKGKSQLVTLSFNYPTSLPAGSYQLVAVTDSNNGVVFANGSSKIAASPAVIIGPATVNLSASFSKVPASVKIGKSASASVLVQNTGNTAAKGHMEIDLYESSTPTLGAGKILLHAFSQSVSIKANGSKNFSLTSKIPATAVAGSEYLIAVVNSGNTVPLGNTTTAAASSQTVFA